MTVTVYVEGRSDRAALEAVLAKLLDEKRAMGVDIRFYEAPPTGDRKTILLTKIPVKALDILRNLPDSVVVVLPDLYPPNKGFPHRTPDEMRAGVMLRFAEAGAQKGLRDIDSLSSRFHVFCFKHEMEVLLLAARERLAEYLNCAKFVPDWTARAEDQNHDDPPSRVVERWFRTCGRRYDKVTDARAILTGADYRALADHCDQCFKPFVEFLESCGPAA
jgi:hypothetical protein